MLLAGGVSVCAHARDPENGQVVTCTCKLQRQELVINEKERSQVHVGDVHMWVVMSTVFEGTYVGM